MLFFLLLPTAVAIYFLALVSTKQGLPSISHSVFSLGAKCSDQEAYPNSTGEIHGAFRRNLPFRSFVYRLLYVLVVKGSFNRCYGTLRIINGLLTGLKLWVYVEVTLARTKIALIGQSVRSMAVAAEPGLSIDTEPVISFSGPGYVYVKVKSQKSKASISDLCCNIISKFNSQ